MTASSSLASRSIAASAQAILEELGDPLDLTLVRGVGNRGDDLIQAGTQALLAGHIYREIELEQLPAASGDTVLLTGGGAFCRTYNELMPRALAVAAMRFERVIVLPSSFDPSEDRVRDVLARTSATVFARELYSYRRIIHLCDARIAHDCAFFFDFEPYRRQGRGTLNAFRTDAEAIADRTIPHDNDDISCTAATLEDWLERIADHDTVQTDRAHVMIAAAMLGKRVRYLPNAYHKLDGIAEYALAEEPVTRLEPRAQSVRGPSARHRPRRAGETPSPRVTAVILTRDRAQRALAAIDSLASNDAPARILVFDNNNAPEAAAVLSTGVAARDAELRRWDRNVGCAGGRSLALEYVESEFVLFLDDDAELLPGALDALVAELDAHPEVGAVTATVELPDGSVHHSGGWIHVAGGIAEFILVGYGESPEALAPSGSAGWVPGTALLARRGFLERFPLDVRMTAYYEDNEWCYRVSRAVPGAFRRSREARAVHHFSRKHFPGVDFTTRSDVVDLLGAHAHFYARHRLVLGVDVFDLVPELRDRDGRRDVVGARVLMELVRANGPDWVFAEWMNGGLDTVMSGGRRLTDLAHEVDAQRHVLAERDRQIAVRDQMLAEQATELANLRVRHETLMRIEQGGWWKLRGRLLPLLRPLSRLRHGVQDGSR